MNLKLTQLLFELGMHIGEHKSKVFNVNSFFLLGVRKNLHIIDLNVTVYFLKNACNFLKNLGSKQSYLFFYYTNLSNLDKRLISFFIFHLYRSNHSFLFNNWKHGLLSNYNMQASDVLVDLFPGKNSIKSNIKFTSLLFKMIYFSFNTREAGMRWFKHLKVIKKYWRFFVFYCFFKNLNSLPDVAIIMNANKMITPVKECNSLKIPVVGVVDSDSKSNFFTYPIPGNDNSFLIAAFLFILFINCYKKGLLSNLKY